MEKREYQLNVMGDLPEDLPTTLVYGCLMKYIDFLAKDTLKLAEEMEEKNIPQEEWNTSKVKVAKKWVFAHREFNRELEENRFIASFIKDEFQQEQSIFPKRQKTLEELRIEYDIAMKPTYFKMVQKAGSEEALLARVKQLQSIGRSSFILEAVLYKEYRSEKLMEALLAEGYQRAEKLYIPFDNRDDFAQEYTERCWRSYERWQKFSDDGPTLYRWKIARNLCKEFLRKQRKVRRHERLILEDISLAQTERARVENFLPAVHNSEEVISLQSTASEIMQYLSAKEQKHFKLIVKEASNEQAARILDVSKSAERARRSRLLKKIRGMK